MGKLYAISDIHLSYPQNRQALQDLKPHPEDSVILAGDIGEKAEHLRLAFSTYTSKFKKTWWVPGNHELYTLPSISNSDDQADTELRGELKYRECVSIAREYGVLTPEDDFEVWDDSEDDSSEPVIVAPLFTLYDYSFRPNHVSRAGALDWAAEEGVEATDEALLHNDPWPSRDAWCADLVRRFEQRLTSAREKFPGLKTVLINHWPLIQKVCYLWMIPRFCIWCGTTKTQDWHKRFDAKVVVSGHLHIRRTDWIEGVRFEEVSWGYPRQWKEARDAGQTLDSIMREILPGPKAPESGNSETKWRRYG